MTPGDKELLIKDLCARLPYGVKCKYDDRLIINILSVDFFWEKIEGWERYVNHTLKYDIEDIKPYLFPLSSMTDEQEKELNNIGWYFDTDTISNSETYYSEDTDYTTHMNCCSLIDWLNKNHFDYRGLIEKGLAIDATGLNIY